MTTIAPGLAAPLQSLWPGLRFETNVVLKDSDRRAALNR